MTDDLSELVHLLRNTPVRELVSALRRDGFVLERETRTGGRIYSHPDGVSPSFTTTTAPIPSPAEPCAAFLRQPAGHWKTSGAYGWSDNRPLHPSVTHLTLSTVSNLPRR